VQKNAKNTMTSKAMIIGYGLVNKQNNNIGQ